MATVLTNRFTHALAFVLAAGAEAGFWSLPTGAQPAVYFGGKSAHRFCPFNAVTRESAASRCDPIQAHSLIDMGCRWAGTSFAPSETRASISCREPAISETNWYLARPTPVYQTSIS